MTCIVIDGKMRRDSFGEGGLDQVLYHLQKNRSPSRALMV